jgi:uncharacterized membrane protein
VTQIDDYLAEVGSAMTGMEPRVRQDILEELRSHLADSASTHGGDLGRAIEDMGPPKKVGREYRAVYGYSRGYKLVFVVLAAVLAALTLPVFQGATSPSGIPDYSPNLLALPFLVLVVLWLLWVSAQAGSRAGLYAGIGASVGRLGAAFLLFLVPSGGIVTAGGLAVLLLSSALLVLLGWLPGTAKKAWSKPTGDL